MIYVMIYVMIYAMIFLMIYNHHNNMLVYIQLDNYKDCMDLMDCMD